MCAVMTPSTLGAVERSREAACASSAKLFPFASRKALSSAASLSVGMDREVCFPVSGSRHSTAQVTLPSLRSRRLMLARPLRVGLVSTKTAPVSTPGPSFPP